MANVCTSSKAFLLTYEFLPKVRPFSIVRVTDRDKGPRGVVDRDGFGRSTIWC